MADRLDNGKVAARYAKALFDSIIEAYPDGNPSNEINQVASSLQSFADVLKQAPEFFTFWENPAIALAEKARFTEERLLPDSPPRVAMLLRLLMENNRIALLPLLAERFTSYVNQRENIAEAEVITAAELDTDTQARMQHTLQSLFGFSRINLQSRVDPGLLGGAIIKIQDRIIDGSYVGRLEALRRQVANV